MDLDLKEKYAIVCGSTQGLGFASAIELALLGANVTLVARMKEKLKKRLQSLIFPNNRRIIILLPIFNCLTR
jgi:3-oxoacyl-[acyl-carrier protein] reductase